MPSVYCDRDECRYRSLGGWCNLGNPSWRADKNTDEISCERIMDFRLSNELKQD